MFTIPAVQKAIRYADIIAVPVIAGLSMAALAEIILSLTKVSDNRYHLKTICEVASAIAGFFLARKNKDLIAISVTSFFGAFLATMAGSLLSKKLPLNDQRMIKNGDIS